MYTEKDENFGCVELGTGVSSRQRSWKNEFFGSQKLEKSGDTRCCKNTFLQRCADTKGSSSPIRCTKRYSSDAFYETMELDGSELPFPRSWKRLNLWLDVNGKRKLRGMETEKDRRLSGKDRIVASTELEKMKSSGKWGISGYTKLGKAEGDCGAPTELEKMKSPVLMSRLMRSSWPVKTARQTHVAMSHLRTVRSTLPLDTTPTKSFPVSSTQQSALFQLDEQLNYVNLHWRRLFGPV